VSEGGTPKIKENSWILGVFIGSDHIHLFAPVKSDTPAMVEDSRVAPKVPPHRGTYRARQEEMALALLRWS
jgi:hypothetical protein